MLTNVKLYVVALDVNSYQLCLQCSPYHIEDKVLIMGDAAHAMLPFLAQGVNSVCVNQQFLCYTICVEKYGTIKP